MIPWQHFFFSPLQSKTALAKPPLSKEGRALFAKGAELVLCVSGNQTLATPELIQRLVFHNIWCTAVCSRMRWKGNSKGKWMLFCRIENSVQWCIFSLVLLKVRGLPNLSYLPHILLPILHSSFQVAHIDSHFSGWW